MLHHVSLRVSSLQNAFNHFINALTDDSNWPSLQTLTISWYENALVIRQ